MRRLTIAILASALVASVSADELKVPLNGRDDLVLDLPAGWAGTIRSPGPGLPPTIVVAGRDRREFQLLITAIAPAGDVERPTSEELQRLVRAAADRALAKAEEPEIGLRELAADGKVGWYYSLTDRHPEPGGYKLLTQGAVGFEELRITFSLLLNGDPQATTRQALDVLRTMRRAAADAGQGASPGYAIAFPGSDLPRVVLPGAGWRVAQVRRKPDGSGTYHLLSDETRKLNFSIYIEQKMKCRSAAECLEASLTNPTYKDMRDLRRFESGPFKAATFVIDRLAGTAFTQGNLVASAFVDGHWLDVHVSRLGPADMDLAPLVELLGSIELK